MDEKVDNQNQLNNEVKDDIIVLDETQETVKTDDIHAEPPQKNLKQKTFSSMIWKFAERIIAQGVSLIVSIILANLITPEEYSVIGIVGIFFAFANVFISGGFNAALIQKKGADEEDYSSVLWISLSIATALYIILFFCAPWIADLYDKPILVPVFRVMSITLIILAIKSVLCAYVSKHLEFKKFFFSTIGGTVVSAIVGITMAVYGYGPWALVAQQMINALVDTAIIWITTRVKFRFKITKNKAGGLFKYGWKLLLASSISVLYDQTNPLIIGVKFTGADLSFYTKGKSFPNLINETVGNSLSAVLFPVIATVQDEKDKVLNYTRNFLRVISYCIFPLMLGFIVVADNFIKAILPPEWGATVIYVQAFCIVYAFDIVQVTNLQVIRAIGRSDLILIMEIIKKVLYFVNILLWVLFTNDPRFLALACVINTFIALAINTFPNRKLIGYKYRYQILDLLPNFLTALVMAVAVYFIGWIPISVYILLPVQVIAGIGIYISASLITKNKNLTVLLGMLKGLFKKIKTHKNSATTE